MQIMNMLGKCGGRFGDSGIRRERNKVRGGAIGISIVDLRKTLTRLLVVVPQSLEGFMMKQRDGSLGWSLEVKCRKSQVRMRSVKALGLREKATV